MAIGICFRVKSLNLLSDKLSQKFGFRIQLALLQMNSIFLSLLLFGVVMKKVKTKAEKFQLLSIRALHSVTVVSLIHHIWLHGLMRKTSGHVELKLE